MKSQMRWCVIIIGALFVCLGNSSYSATEAYVTKDGKIYVGKAVIRGEETIVIRTEQDTVTLNKKDLLELSETELEARVLLWQAEQAKAEADKAYLADDPGKASYYYDVSLSSLASIEKRTEEQFSSARELIDEITLNKQRLKSTLDARGLTAYKGQLFTKPILDYHLAKGHFLIGKGVWINPSQQCDKCEMNGKILCPKCAGKGQLIVDCPDCQGGVVTCPNCKGSGQVICQQCKGTGGHWTSICNSCLGTGETTKRCKYCNGRGKVTDNCNLCRSRGYIIRRILITNDSGEKIWVNRHFTCPACYGLGYDKIICSECSGSGTTTITCRQCNGIGKISGYCFACRGGGYVPCCKYIACSKCRAKGILQEQCNLCGGKAYIICPDCDGKKYTGEPCSDPTESLENKN